MTKQTSGEMIAYVKSLGDEYKVKKEALHFQLLGKKISPTEYRDQLKDLNDEHESALPSVDEYWDALREYYESDEENEENIDENVKIDEYNSKLNDLYIEYSTKMTDLYSEYYTPKE